MRPSTFFSFLLSLALPPGGASLAGCQQKAGPVTRDGEAGEGVGTLVEISTMSSPRAAHTATALPDGRVLLAGGFTGEERSAAGVEMYDPASGTFVPTGEPVRPRHSHTATRLADGKVLLAGGYDAGGAYLSSAEVYDPANGEFTPAGAMKSARADHLAVRLQDGRVLVVGGVGAGWTFLSSAELYDPATRTFASTGAMLVPRESHAAVTLRDGRVLVVGGHSGRGAGIQLYSSAEIYTPASGTFTAAGEMAIRRHKHDAVLLADGRVLVTGGTDERDNEGVYTSTETYDPATGAFVPAGELRLARYKHRGTSISMIDGRVLLAGGAAQAEVYDPRAGTFTLVRGEPRMPGQFSAAAPLPDGRVLITGGYGGNRGPRSSAWLFQP